MSESVASDKAPKRSWIKGIRSEFKKIAWPGRKAVIKQTVAVAIISVLLGALIKVLDMLIQLGLSYIV